MKDLTLLLQVVVHPESLLQLLLQADIGRLAVIVEYHEQCQQRKRNGYDDGSAQEYETDVALAHGTVVKLHGMLGVYALHLGAALHTGYRVEQCGVAVDVGGYGIGAAFGKGQFDEFVIGVAVGIHITTGKQGEVEIVASRIGESQGQVDVAFDAVVGTKATDIIHGTDVVIDAAQGLGIVFGMIAGNLCQLEGCLIGDALRHLFISKEGTEARSGLIELLHI